MNEASGRLPTNLLRARVEGDTVVGAQHTKRQWRAGLLVGIGVAIAVVAVGGGVPGRTGTVGNPVAAPQPVAATSVVTITATPTGELAVEPTEVRLLGTQTPGVADFVLLNQTGGALEVDLSADDGDALLTDRISVAIALSGVPVFSGPIADVDVGMARFVLASGESAQLGVELSIAGPACTGCSTVIALGFTSVPVER